MSIDLEQALEILESQPLPQELAKWLMRLKLLMGVSFQHLVPDEALLPPESLRFFHLDEDWINALVDGAMSIGRIYTGSESETPHLMADVTHHESLHGLANGSLPNFRLEQLSLEPPELVPTPFPDQTGFLLRSELVRGWKGIDFQAFAKGHSPYDYAQKLIGASDVQAMKPLRLETLSDTVLFGLFDGTIYELVIHQPPEAIHFGFIEVDLDGGQVNKNFRVPNNTWQSPEGYDNENYKDQPLTGVFRDTKTRVLNMNELAKKLAQSFAKEPINKIPGYYQANPDAKHIDRFVASDFALEMVQTVGLVSFINHPVSPGNL